ncbi:hypothetical protein F5B20DRAFT_257327 [Whalleya microplaca]|nr:hypothetical protein F5B20DRAFT_257327 [Whalleya microplaca]
MIKSPSKLVDMMCRYIQLFAVGSPSWGAIAAQRMQRVKLKTLLVGFVSTHQLCKRKNDAECWLRWNSPEKYHCCRSDPTYHSKFYIEYYEVIKLLLRRGFQPCLSSWRFLLSHVVRDRWHIEHAHPELRSSIDFSYRSVPLLIQEAAGFAVPVLSANTFDDKLEIWFPRIYTAYSEQYSAMSNGFSHEVDSHLTSIITLEHASDTITKEFLTLDVPDLAGDEFIFDRWLLVIFSFFDTSLDRLLQNYLKSYSNKEIRSLFQVQKVLEELRYIQDRSSPGLSREKWIELSDKQWELIRYICFNGSLEMLKWLADNEISLSPGLIATAQSQDKEKFDFAFSLGTFYWNFQSPLLHTEMLRRRLVEEPEFRCRILNRLFFESSHYNFIVAPDEPILGFLRCDMIIDLLWIPESYKLPEYIVLLIEGLIQRYESATHIISGREIYGIVRGAMRFHWDRSRSAHEVTRSKHLYQVLRRIATLPAFRCALDYLGGGEYYDGVPLTRGRTNHSMYEVHPNPSVNGCTPLMVALHCGMSPVVQILVDAGASILLRSLNGKSPLQLAYENVQAVHPRPWAAAFDRKDGVIISGLMPYSGDRLKGPAEKLWVSESMDKAMLEILLTALRDRGEDVNEAELVMEPLTDTAWMRMKTRTKSILAWLMRPSYHFDIDEFRQKSAYVAMITTLWVLSILKLLKLKFGPYVPVVVDLLSRPVIILSLVVCIASMLIR